jgi:hypothetical protein
MLIVKAPAEPQAPLGVACYADAVAPRPTPLRTELEKGSVGRRFYKHGAPNGAFADGVNCEVFELAAAPSGLGFRPSEFGFPAPPV